MRKTITINGTEYKFKSSAAIPRIHRLKFGRDIFVDMQKIEKQIKIQEKLKDEMQKKCAKEGTEFDESKFESGIPSNHWKCLKTLHFRRINMETWTSRTISTSGWISSRHLISMRFCQKSWKCGNQKINRCQFQKKRGK